MIEESQAQADALVKMGLRACPCCGAPAEVSVGPVSGDITVACSKKLCITVTALTKIGALQMWNQKGFRDARPI